MNPASNPRPPSTPPTAPAIEPPNYQVRTVRGDVESWPLFWEQFQSSLDTNPSVSHINKHVFFTGYLDGEPKHRAEGIAVTAETYEETKRVLHTKYGDKNRIIQAHLYYLEGIKLMLSATPELLYTTYVESTSGPSSIWREHW
jgi:hypothetical protein